MHKPMNLFLVFTLLAGVLALQGCVATTCGDDIMQCRGRCKMALECKDTCRQGTCPADCKKEYFASCRQLGVLYSHGMGVERDEAKAIDYFQTACDHNDALACTHLGFMYENGSGVVANQSKALSYYTTGCNDHVATACLGKERLEDSGGSTPSASPETPEPAQK